MKNVNKFINLAFAVNNLYVKHLNVTIFSIIRNNPQTIFNIFVLCDNLTKESIKSLNKITNFYDNLDIKIIELSKHGYDFDKFIIPKNLSFITKEMYFRYALSEILPELDKVLYLDADLIVLGSIGDLYERDIDDYYLVGVKDAGLELRFPDHLKNIGMMEDDAYINSGVLLMNLKNMRQDEVCKKLLKNTKKYEAKLLFPDQDMLNLTLKGKINTIHKIYNFTDQDMLDDKTKIDDIKILHFTGEVKPWDNVVKSYTKKYIDIYKQYENEYYQLIMNELNLLVSVIIPIYNVESYIAECLDSVINQTYKNLEIIVVDDKSPDKSGKIVDRYAKNDSRIKVIHKNDNKGSSEARHTGFKASSGDYVMFVDGDDIIALNAIEISIQNIIKFNTDIAIFTHKSFKNDTDLIIKEKIGKRNPKTKVYRGDFVRCFFNQEWREFIKGPIHLLTVWGKVYKKTLLNDINWDLINFRTNEDEAFVCYPYKNAKDGVVMIDAPLYLYRDNHAGKSIGAYSNKYHGKSLTRLQFMQKIFEVQNEILGLKYKNQILNDNIYHTIILYERDLLGYEKEATNSVDDDIEQLKQNLSDKIDDFLNLPRSYITSNYVYNVMKIIKNDGVTGYFRFLINNRDEQIKNMYKQVELLKTENANLKANLNSFLSIKRSTKLLAGNIKRRILHK